MSFVRKIANSGILGPIPALIAGDGKKKAVKNYYGSTDKQSGSLITEGSSTPSSSLIGNSRNY